MSFSYKKIIVVGLFCSASTVLGDFLGLGGDFSSLGGDFSSLGGDFAALGSDLGGYAQTAGGYVGVNFSSIADSIASMAKGLGAGFGASPHGYDYSYTIVNDTTLPIYVNTQRMASFMGGCFPEANGRHQNVAPPMSQNLSVDKMEYYFEMSIHATSHQSANELPYVNTDALYIQDCIQLATKDSTKMNYFHVYMGKKIEDGHYLHTPKAEYMGYADPEKSSDKGASVTMSGVITGDPALTIYNSTQDDLLVGYSSKISVKSLQKSDCDLFFVTMKKNSFALHSGSLDVATKSKSLALGTVGVFDQASNQATEVFAMPSSVFGGQSYALEIYQDYGQSRAMGLQALMSAHDVPSSRVRDITPCPCVFWYQSVAQLSTKDAKGMADLSGQVWVASKGDDDVIYFQVPVGTAMQYPILRPELGKKRWVYFIYVDTVASDPKAAIFIENFIAGKNGANVVAQYEQQSLNQFDEIQKQLSDTLTFAPDAKGNMPDPKKIVAYESLLIAAIEGALKVDRGQIQDSSLNLTGYLLGADVFTPQGVGASDTFYYQLAPSQQLTPAVPTSSVINGYTMGITSAPKKMPTPTQYIKKS